MVVHVAHLACGAYEEGLFGGVPRFDHQLKLIFPDRVLIRDPMELDRFLQAHPHAAVVADNHFALMVPADVPCIIVHHGVAPEHFKRAPQRVDLRAIAAQQSRLWEYRRPENTLVVSISTFCTDMFAKHFGERYTRFPRVLLPHASEHDEAVVWKPRGAGDDDPHRKLVVLGNFQGYSKGERRAQVLAAIDPRLELRPLRVHPCAMDANGIADFEARKQACYMECDVFLQLSVHEGNSYATLDALAVGVPIVATDVGAFYKDVPDECFVRVPWDAAPHVVRDAIWDAHARRAELGKAARSFYMANWRMDAWKTRMHEIVVAGVQNSAPEIKGTAEGTGGE